MRSLLYILTACAVIGLAFWAYRENYETQKSLAETERLQREIGSARARMSVLKAEWAYLNRPDRLQDLVDVNFGRLGLLPLRPDQFGKVDQIAFPPEPELIINNPIDVSGMQVAGEEIVTQEHREFP